MPLTSPGNDDDTGENHQPTLRKNTAEPTQQTLKQYTYLTHYNETRIKKSLDWISPMQHRKHLGLSA